MAFHLLKASELILPEETSVIYLLLLPGVCPQDRTQGHPLPASVQEHYGRMDLLSNPNSVHVLKVAGNGVFWVCRPAWLTEGPFCVVKHLAVPTFLLPYI